tara:strand:+ start:40 stop:798 length:759 start_codon:yes stop_codon:yes gene_type:complete
MAYMGDTPKFENIRWKNTGSSAPGSPEAGQFYYNTGTGTDAEGFWIYASADGTSTGTKAWRHISPTNNASNFTTGMLGSAFGGVPVGTVLTYVRGDSSDSLPTGYLLCDGASISQSTYSALYAVTGLNFGDGTTGTGAAGTGNFNLPDFRGFFLRGRVYSSTGTEAGRDPDCLSRTNLLTGGATALNLGSYQDQQFKAHNHTTTAVRLTGSSQNMPNSTGPQINSIAQTSTDTGGNETRPKNIYVEYIIKHS